MYNWRRFFDDFLLSPLGVPLASLLALTLLLGGCAGESNEAVEGRGNPGVESRTSGDELNLFIWAEYTSPQILAEFERATGVHVRESNYGSNEELLAKLQAGATGYDIVCPSDYMISILIKLGQLEPLGDLAPELKPGFHPWLMNHSFDRGNLYSLPYSWAVTGIILNRKVFREPVSGYLDLFQSRPLAGRISLLDDVREAFGASLRTLGQSANCTDTAILRRGQTAFLDFKERLKEFNSTPATALLQGDVLAAQIYSNEAFRIIRDHPEGLEFIVPREGGTLAIDNLAILKNAPHKESARKFIRFVSQSRTNGMLVEELLTGPVIAGAAAEFSSGTLAIPLIRNPDLLGKSWEILRDLGDSLELYDRIWTEIKAY